MLINAALLLLVVVWSPSRVAFAQTGSYPLERTWIGVLSFSPGSVTLIQFEFAPGTNQGGLFMQGERVPWNATASLTESGHLLIKASHATQELNFESPSSPNHIFGSVNGNENLQGRFYLTRSASLPLDAFDRLIGVYQMDNGETVLVSRADQVTETFYWRAGEQVRLYATAENRFLSALGEEFVFETQPATPQASAISISSVLYPERSYQELATRTQLYEEIEMQVKTGGANLSGTLYLPQAHEKQPAVILLHGSGARQRHYYRLFADAFARQGIAALIYDQRGSGKSGSLTKDPSSEVLAQDALRWWRKLTAMPQIDAQRIGIWGLSGGARIAPMAASSEPEIAFVIGVSTPGLPQASLALWELSRQLQMAGFPKDQVSANLRATRLRTWISGGQATFSSHDPVDDWLQVHQPVLLLYGNADSQILPQLSAARIQRALLNGSNTQISLAVYPQADHNLMISDELGRVRIASGALELPGNWIKQGYLSNWQAFPDTSNVNNTPGEDAFATGGEFGPNAWYGQPLLHISWYLLSSGVFAYAFISGLILASRGTNPKTQQRSEVSQPVMITSLLFLISLLIRRFSLPASILEAGSLAPNQGAITFLLLILPFFTFFASLSWGYLAYHTCICISQKRPIPFGTLPVLAFGGFSMLFGLYWKMFSFQQLLGILK